ncbi:hypothetical protein Ahy_A07g035914 [Arachis hypogaea]|uniref:Alpha-D-phosphohexomutase alpha/beta/alpha domain-containing protein n=1 Tax=Arachis hypogaea TaxID=3818 RepID=A0A445CES5_ARAHY|nr:hypothetical protein Ahy_A07g035914 [Arachis hypogaea]
MREGRAAATARTARRGSRAVSRVAIREGIAVREAISVSGVVTVVAGFHHASSPPPRRAPCRRRHCSVTREGREGGNRTAREFSHGERRRVSDLSPRVRPLPNHVAVCEAVAVAAAGGRHRSHRSTSVILLFTVTSHLPFNRNGFKFFTNAGGLGKTDIKDVLERAADIYNQFTAESLANSERKASSSIKQVDYMNVYTSDLVKAVRKAAGSIEKPLAGFHIVVDAGNGPNDEKKVLEPFEAFTTGSQFLEPDGVLKW